MKQLNIENLYNSETLCIDAIIDEFKNYSLVVKSNTCQLFIASFDLNPKQSASFRDEDNVIFIYNNIDNELSVDVIKA